VERHDLADNGRQNYLVFRAGSFERLAVPLSLVARLEEFPLNRIEHAGGRLVIQYRGQILHLVQLSALLDRKAVDASTLRDPVQVVVFSDRDRVLGLIVDQVVDIINEAISVRQRTERDGLAGAAVVGKKVTDFLDLVSVLRAAEEDWFGDEVETIESAAVLVVDGSAFSRALTKNSLELAGHRVVEAAGAADAAARMDKERFDVAVVSADLPGDGTAMLLRHVKSSVGTRVVVITTKAAEIERGEAFPGCDARVLRSDREGLLRAVLGVPEGAAMAAAQARADVAAQRS
jgi:two-component system chemotaxis sensor kinase CheA